VRAKHGDITIRALNGEEARIVASWQYGDELSMYDGDPDHHEGLLAMTPEGYGYYAIVVEPELLGYCCFGPEGRVPGQLPPEDDLLDVGGGLRPDLVGKGLGSVGFPLVLAYGRQRFSPPGFRTAIASFNKRSIVLCRWAGFRTTATLVGPGGREFTELTLIEQRVGV